MRIELAYNLVCGTSSFCKPSLACGPMGVLFLDSFSTKTWVYPPTAAGVSSLPCSKTPTSYVTELVPKLFTLKPRSRTWGNPRGAKNCSSRRDQRSRVNLSNAPGSVMKRRGLLKAKKGVWDRIVRWGRYSRLNRKGDNISNCSCASTCHCHSSEFGRLENRHSLNAVSLSDCDWTCVKKNCD